MNFSDQIFLGFIKKYHIFIIINIAIRKLTGNFNIGDPGIKAIINVAHIGILTFIKFIIAEALALSSTLEVAIPAQSVRLIGLERGANFFCDLIFLNCSYIILSNPFADIYFLETFTIHHPVIIIQKFIGYKKEEVY
jgi:hypothetical protein